MGWRFCTSVHSQWFIFSYRKYKRTGGYAKDDLLEDPLGHEHAYDDITHEGRDSPKKSTISTEPGTTTFDNPIYDSHNLEEREVEMIGYETKLSDTDEQSLKAALDDYQPHGDNMREPSLDYDLDTDEAEAIRGGRDEDKTPALYKYDKLWKNKPLLHHHNFWC